MFDIGWSELLILGIVTLIFVGPKDLPRFMATLGRYAGVVRRHAAEFRQQFDEAMREAELDRVNAEIKAMHDDVKGTFDDAKRSVTAATESASRETKRIAAAAEHEQVAQAAQALDAPSPEPAEPRAGEPAPAKADATEEKP